MWYGFPHLSLVKFLDFINVRNNYMLMLSIKSPFYSSEKNFLFTSAKKWKEVKLTVITMHSDFMCSSVS